MKRNVAVVLTAMLLSMLLVLVDPSGSADEAAPAGRDGNVYLHAETPYSEAVTPGQPGG